jgi:hypothetical protein
MDTKQLVTDKISELKPLYNRMDEDKDLLYQVDYVLKNFKNNPIDNVINVTMNTAAKYAVNIITELMGAKWQVTVDGDMTDKRKTLLKNIVEDLLIQADEQLANQGKSWLFDWLCNHVCTRCGIGARWVYQPSDLTNMCLPVDMRWTPFQYTTKGMAWACNITYRNSSELNAEYVEQLDSKPVSGKDLEVWDFWNDKVNEIWIGGNKILEQSNPFGYPPFVFAFPATGFMLRDKGYLEYEHESIFMLGRKLFDEENRSVSIAQTRAFEVIASRYEQERETMDDRPADAAPKPGQTIAVRKGEKHQLLQQPDITAAYQVAENRIKSAIDDVTANSVDMGNVSEQSSGLLFSSQYEVRAKVTNPRLRTLARFYEQSAKMILDQVVKTSGKKETELKAGKTGKKHSYQIAQIGNPEDYSITYEMKIRSDTQETANRAQFFASKGQLPLRTRLVDILKADDPDRIMREMEVEEAKQADPAIGLFEMALRYCEEADSLDAAGDDKEANAKRIQSKMLTERCVALIKQRAQQPQQLPQEAVTPMVDKSKGNTNLMQTAMASQAKQPMEVTNG